MCVRALRDTTCINSISAFIPQRLGTCDSGTLQHTRSIGSEADRTASSYNLNYEEMDPAELYDDEEDDNDLDEEEEQDEEEETTDDSEGEYVCEMDTEDELEGRLHDVSEESETESSSEGYNDLRRFSSDDSTFDEFENLYLSTHLH